MKRPGLILKQEQAKEQTNAVATVAAYVFRAALTDTLGAGDGEPFSDALNRRIDERIAARRWWRFWA